jgi:hypothetical protein
MPPQQADKAIAWLLKGDIMDEEYAENPNARIYDMEVRTPYTQVRSMQVTIDNFMELKDFMKADEVTVHNFGNEVTQSYEFKSGEFNSSRYLRLGDFVVQRVDWETKKFVYEVYERGAYVEMFEDREKTGTADSIDSDAHLTEDTLFKFAAIANSYIGKTVSSDRQQVMVSNFINDLLNAGLLIRER